MTLLLIAGDQSAFEYVSDRITENGDECIGAFYMTST